MVGEVETITSELDSADVTVTWLPSFPYQLVFLFTIKLECLPRAGRTINFLIRVRQGLSLPESFLLKIKVILAI